HDRSARVRHHTIIQRPCQHTATRTRIERKDIGMACRPVGRARSYKWGSQTSLVPRGTQTPGYLRDMPDVVFRLPCKGFVTVAKRLLPENSYTRTGRPGIATNNRESLG